MARGRMGLTCRNVLASSAVTVMSVTHVSNGKTTFSSWEPQQLLENRVAGVIPFKVDANRLTLDGCVTSDMPYSSTHHCVPVC
jgi:hypothetical protein